MFTPGSPSGSTADTTWPLTRCPRAEAITLIVNQNSSKILPIGISKILKLQNILPCFDAFLKG
jgi:hypothetical protein